MTQIRYFLIAISLLSLAGCHSKLMERTDKIYSRHLQKHIDLTVFNTSVPKDKSSFNLLLLNDGQDIEKLRVKEIVDSLNRKKLVLPLVVVAINAFDRMQEYGVAGNPDFRGNGSSAEKYANFIVNELLPFIKKQAGARKFNSVTLAGYGRGGLSAFDIGWNNWQKFDKIGVFSGDFSSTDLDPADEAYSPDKNNLVLRMVNTSRKRPKLKYWFYAGSKDDNPVLKNGSTNQAGKLMVALEAKNFISPGDIVYKEMAEGGNEFSAWTEVFPSFLIWAAGK